jgi:hypothetical protein
VFYEGKGLEVTESFQSKAGETINKRYTVWLATPTVLDIGSEVKVKGLYSSEIDNWTTKEGEARQTVKISINNPQVIPTDPASVVKGFFEPTHEPSPF